MRILRGHGFNKIKTIQSNNSLCQITYLDFVVLETLEVLVGKDFAEEREWWVLEWSILADDVVAVDEVDT